MPDIVIDTFRGDVEALEKMAHTAWKDEYGVDSYPNLYKPEYLAYLMSEVGDPRMAMAAYHGGEIVGYLLNLPRTMALDGKNYRAALSCLLVVRQKFFRQGLANQLIQEGLKRNAELKFDFTLFYLETGHRSSRLFHKLQAAGMPIERVKRMNTIARVLNIDAVLESENVKSYEVLAMKLLGASRKVKSPGLANIREATAADAPAILELMNAHQKKFRLARAFTEAELVRELITPPVAKSLVWEKDGRVAAALSWVMVDHVGRTTVPWAWLNHVAWDALDLKERRQFISEFMARASAGRAAGVVEWAKRVYPTAALYLTGFVPYPRRVDMMSWRFRDDIRLSDIPEVYEVQI